MIKFLIPSLDLGTEIRSIIYCYWENDLKPTFIIFLFLTKFVKISGLNLMATELFLSCVRHNLVTYF